MTGTRANTILAGRFNTADTGSDGLQAGLAASTTPISIAHNSAADYIHRVTTGTIIIGSQQAGFEPPIINNGASPQTATGSGNQGAVVSICCEALSAVPTNSQTIGGVNSTPIVLAANITPIALYQWGVVNTTTHLFTADTSTAQAAPASTTTLNMRALMIQIQNISASGTGTLSTQPALMEAVFSLLVQSFGATASGS